MNLLVGRVTPCAPGAGHPSGGAHGVTRPTTQVQGFKARNFRSGNSHPGPLPLGEGESFPVVLAKRTLGYCGGQSDDNQAANGGSFSRREKARMRGNALSLNIRPQFFLAALGMRWNAF